MPRFYGRLFALKLNKGQFTKTFNQELNLLMRNAARAWLRAVIVKVPVWTGIAKGSVKFAHGANGNLGRFLNVQIPISPRSKYPKHYWHPSRITPILKVPVSGGKFARYRFSDSRHIFRFTFRTDIVHYIINEFYGSTVSGPPWNSLAAGKLAFNRYIKANIKKLPKVKDFIIKSEIPIGL